jgi:hypothetical protein
MNKQHRGRAGRRRDRDAAHVGSSGNVWRDRRGATDVIAGEGAGRLTRSVLALVGGGVLAGSAAAQQDQAVQREPGGPKSTLEERFVGGAKAEEASTPQPAAATPQVATVKSDDSRAWAWRIAPYLWAANLDGDVKSGPIKAEADIDFDDLFDDLNAAGFVIFEARSHAFAFVGDVTFLDFEQDAETPAGLDNDIDTESVILDLVGLYRIGPSSPLEIGAGIRYMDADFELDTGGGVDSDIFDGVFAARASWPIAERWNLSLYGDIGAGDSDLTWQASALVNYQFDAWGVGLGYRALDYDFEDDNDELDMLIHGLLLGLEFRF